MRGLLIGGAALILIAGPQTALSAAGRAVGTSSPLPIPRSSTGLAGLIPQYGIAPTQPADQPSGGPIDGGSPPLGGGSSPPGSPAVDNPAAVRSAAAGPAAAQTRTTAPAGGIPVVLLGVGPIPATVLSAYLDAQRRLAASAPNCHLPWQLLAAIGEVESGQAEGGNLTADGTPRTPILGPPLNGNGYAAIRTGGGSWARAQGPMQFIPSTWAVWGVDGNGDGTADPQNVFDAASSAADYLCSGGRKLNNTTDLDRAILGYNDTQAYLAEVLAWMRYYQHAGAMPGRRATSGTPTSSGSDPTSAGNTRPGGSSGRGAGTPTTTTHSPQPVAPKPRTTPRLSPTPTRPTIPTRPTVSPSPTPTPSSPQPPAPSATGTASPSESPAPTSPSEPPSTTRSTSTPCPDPEPSATATATASPSPSPSPTATCL